MVSADQDDALELLQQSGHDPVCILQLALKPSVRLLGLEAAKGVPVKEISGDAEGLDLAITRVFEEGLQERVVR
jgi:hypothetical protein